jgi:hypothetical protein
MIDVSTEQLLTLPEATRCGLLHDRTAVSTLWRWRKHGSRGVRLETVSIGGRVYTSREALLRFIGGTTAAADNQPAPLRSPKARERAIARAEKELEQAGI